MACPSRLTGNQSPRERALIDDDEIDPLLAALDYLIKIKYDVTTLPSFEASFTTKSGMKIAANSCSLQYDDHPRIFLSSVQMSQLYAQVDEARKNLATLKAPK
ncbi:MAG: hypothetical protein WDN00_08220 [Limisphaerales bacterium]